MNSIISCQQVCYHYDDGLHTTTILDNLNLEVGQAESVAILGQSGCGKSTLLNLLGGIDRPSSGKVWIHNIDTVTLNENQITKLRGQYLGFVYQFHHLLKDFTALKNVMLPLLIRGVKNTLAKTQAETLLKVVGLENRTTHLPAELSGGERQRVAVARAIITQPKCLLADEPTGNLDATNANQILDLMLQLNQQQNCALVIVTHDKKIATKMERVLLLENGKLREA